MQILAAVYSYHLSSPAEESKISPIFGTRGFTPIFSAALTLLFTESFQVCTARGYAPQ